MGKVLLFIMIGLAGHSAQAQEFACSGHFPDDYTYLIAKAQAFASRLPISQLVITNGHKTIDLKGSYEAPKSGLFQTHVYTFEKDGEVTTLTVNKEIKPANCGRAGCMDGGVSHQWPKPNESVRVTFVGKLESKEKVTEFHCVQM